uniref:Aldehyde dehydrogenase domain-containing protein n=1 Tax=Ditylenchus dipsaci TaxID=166011 RepID=A0A915D6D4_9BILA
MDNGKSITEAKADVLSCADTFEYFSGVDLSGEHMPYDEQAKRFAYSRREPLGVILLAQLLQCAGLPDGVVNIVQGESETGTALCESAIVRKVSFTGSVATGPIAKNCAQWAVNRRGVWSCSLIIPFETEQEALQIANDTEFGLALAYSLMI